MLRPLLWPEAAPHGPVHLSSWHAGRTHYFYTPPVINAETGRGAGGTLPGALSCAVEEPKLDLVSLALGPLRLHLGLSQGTSATWIPPAPALRPSHPMSSPNPHLLVLQATKFANNTLSPYLALT